MPHALTGPAASAYIAVMHLRLNRSDRMRASLRWTCAAGFLFFLVKGLLWLALGGVFVSNLL